MSVKKLALLGGTPVGKVKEHKFPVFSQRARQRVNKLLEDGRTIGFNRQCPEIAEMEAAVSAYHDGRHAQRHPVLPALIEIHHIAVVVHESHNVRFQHYASPVIC